jgi:hypothetical protein
VFASVSTTPAVVKNGDKLEITANLGETHLFVWADLSPLDSSKNSPVVLIDQGDGTYTREVSLDLWNTKQNGTRSLKVTAMDFWSNVSTTSLEVELNNPAPILDQVPPDDNFNGTVLDSTKWTPVTSGGASVFLDGRLILSTGDQEGSSDAWVESNWNFPGDFDVQVDFDISKGWASPLHDHLDGAYLDVKVAGQDYRITRLRSSDEDKFFAWSNTGVLINSSINAATSGRYRLVRSGTILYLLFDAGQGWQELENTTVPAGPAQIILGIGKINASLAFTTYFDSFKINSGLTTYKP